MDALAERIDRLESRQALTDLCATYALAVDSRDLDRLVGLFVEDVRVGREAQGRSALRDHFDRRLRARFTTSVHLVANHVITFAGPDRASGVLYCRAEHDMGAHYVVALVHYWDDYERVDGAWFFRRRQPHFLYCTNVSDPPTGNQKIRWPDRAPASSSLPGLWPTWEPFWADGPEAP